MSIPPAELDALEALLAGATDAPWQWLDSGGDVDEYDELQDGRGEMVASGFRDDVLRSTVTDGRLCAALRNAAPDLLAAGRSGPDVERLRRIEAAARRFIEGWEGPDEMGDEGEFIHNHPEWPDDTGILAHASAGQLRTLRAALSEPPA